MRLSTSTCIHEKVLWGKDLVFTCKDSIEACVKAGYKVLDMNFASYSRGTLPMTQPDWERWVKEQKEFADSLGVEWNQGHAHFYNWESASQAEREWHEELIRRSIIGAGIMGVKWLVVHPGHGKDSAWYSRKESLAANLEAYARYGELARKHNVGICTENIFENQKSRRYGAAPDEIIELYDAVGDPKSFGICWDTGHGHMTGIDQPEALKLLGKRLKALHVADNHGQNDDHIAPYFGTIKWEPIMKTLKEIEYEGDFTFEIHNFTSGLPHGLHDRVLRFTYELGQFMLNLAK
mgnify:CR=1 FL=1